MNGVRGIAPADTEKLEKRLSRFSLICHEFRDEITEMDINPIIASDTTVVAVDAVLIGRSFSKPGANQNGE